MRLSGPASSTTQASVFPVSPAGSRSVARIRGMHLDREHFTRVEELQQQRKSAESPGQLSHHLFRKLLQQLTDGLPFERSIGDAALMVIAVAEHPCFADRTVARQRRGEQAGQTPAAPEPILIDRFESQRIKITHSFRYFPAASGRRRLSAGEERQVIAHDVDCDGRHHKKEADPYFPVTMRPSPIRVRIMPNTLAGGRPVLMGAVLNLIHRDRTPVAFACWFFSIAALYSPRRAARLHLAR